MPSSEVTGLYDVLTLEISTVFTFCSLVHDIDSPYNNNVAHAHYIFLNLFPNSGNVDYKAPRAGGAGRFLWIGGQKVHFLPIPSGVAENIDALLWGGGAKQMFASPPMGVGKKQVFPTHLRAGKK